MLDSVADSLVVVIMQQYWSSVGGIWVMGGVYGGGGGGVGWGGFSPSGVGHFFGVCGGRGGGIEGWGGGAGRGGGGGCGGCGHHLAVLVIYLGCAGERGCVLGGRGRLWRLNCDQCSTCRASVMHLPCICHVYTRTCLDVV